MIFHFLSLNFALTCMTHFHTRTDFASTSLTVKLILELSADPRAPLPLPANPHAWISMRTFAFFRRNRHIQVLHFTTFDFGERNGDSNLFRASNRNEDDVSAWVMACHRRRTNFPVLSWQLWSLGRGKRHRTLLWTFFAGLSIMIQVWSLRLSQMLSICRDPLQRGICHIPPPLSPPLSHTSSAVVEALFWGVFSSLCTSLHAPVIFLEQSSWLLIEKRERLVEWINSHQISGLDGWVLANNEGFLTLFSVVGAFLHFPSVLLCLLSIIHARVFFLVLHLRRNYSA